MEPIKDYMENKEENKIVFHCLIDSESGELYGLGKNSLKQFCEKIKQSAVKVTIEPR